jgi:flagella basal body P-ring formation protein FlgA
MPFLHYLPLRRLVPAALLPFCAMAPSWAAAAQAGSHAVSVRLNTPVNVEHDAVTLGEIADIEGADPELVQRLRRLPLGRIGAGRTMVELRRGEIARWVCMKGGLCGQQVAWSGTQRVAVQAAPHAVGKAALVEVARLELERALAPLGARLSIEPSDAPDSVALPSGAVVFSARPLPAGTLPGRRMAVWVDAHVNGHFLRTVPVWFVVSAKVPAWVARDEIPVGARVSAADFMPGEADLAEAPGAKVRRRTDTFTSPDQVLLVRRALHPGQPLTAANSGPAPLVARGETALLRVSSSPIELESRVEVLQDGFLGQTVRVRASNAGGTLLAKVAGAGLLEAQN